eukprot:gb/GECH01012364.1/.p1 GENE.gb/GECH01012364.1/~~gb/GECH01012364.1/.p1  ORF type:complete len:1192 (+),score=313.46 gb/GECH01012364.1/:1-3576(+)
MSSSKGFSLANVLKRKGNTKNKEKESSSSDSPSPLQPSIPETSDLDPESFRETAIKYYDIDGEAAERLKHVDSKVLEKLQREIGRENEKVGESAERELAFILPNLRSIDPKNLSQSKWNKVQDCLNRLTVGARTKPIQWIAQLVTLGGVENIMEKIYLTERIPNKQHQHYELEEGLVKSIQIIVNSKIGMNRFLESKSNLENLVYLLNSKELHSRNQKTLRMVMDIMSVVCTMQSKHSPVIESANGSIQVEENEYFWLVFDNLENLAKSNQQSLLKTFGDVLHSEEIDVETKTSALTLLNSMLSCAPSIKTRRLILEYLYLSNIRSAVQSLKQEARIGDSLDVQIEEFNEEIKQSLTDIFTDPNLSADDFLKIIPISWLRNGKKEDNLESFSVYITRNPNKFIEYSNSILKEQESQVILNCTSLTSDQNSTENPSAHEFPSSQVKTDSHTVPEEEPRKDSKNEPNTESEISSSNLTSSPTSGSKPSSTSNLPSSPTPPKVSKSPPTETSPGISSDLPPPPPSELPPPPPQVSDPSSSNLPPPSNDSPPSPSSETISKPSPQSPQQSSSNLPPPVSSDLPPPHQSLSDPPASPKPNNQKASPQSDLPPLQGVGQSPSASPPPPPPPPSSNASLPPPPPPQNSNSNLPSPSSGMPPPPSSNGMPPPPKDSPGPPPPPPSSNSPSSSSGMPPPPSPKGMPPPPSSGMPPPPPGKGGRPPTPGGPPKQPSLPALPERTPEKPTKNIHWSKINQRLINNTIWIKNDIIKKTQDVEIDTDKLEDLFASSAPRKIKKNNNQEQQKPKEVSYIDAKRKQNISITVTSMKLSNEEIKDALLKMKEDVLTIDQLGFLYNLMPTKEEIDAIEGHSPNMGPLSNADKFLLTMSEIRNPQNRIELWMFKRSFDSDTGKYKEEIDNIQKIADVLVKNEKFSKLLAIILAFGNFLNGRSNQKKNAYGFKINALTKLKDLKSKDSNVTLLGYMEEFIRSKYPEISDWYSDFEFMQDMSISVSDLEANVDLLDANKNKLEKEIDDVAANSTNGDDKFNETMTEFVEKAGEEIDKLKKNFKKARDDLKEAGTLFGERQKDMQKKPEEFVQVFSKFVSDWKEVEAKNIEAEKAEKKKKNKGKKNVSIEKQDAKKTEEDDNDSQGLITDNIANLRDGSAFRKARKARAKSGARPKFDVNELSSKLSGIEKK